MEGRLQFRPYPVPSARPQRPSSPLSLPVHPVIVPAFRVEHLDYATYLCPFQMATPFSISIGVIALPVPCGS